MDAPENLYLAPSNDVLEREACQMMTACLEQLAVMSAEIETLLQMVARLTEKYPVKPAERPSRINLLQEGKQP